MTHTDAVRISVASDAAEARRIATYQAQQLKWSDVEIGTANLLATELATNLAKHAQQGALVVTSYVTSGTGRLQLMAVDRGPGIEDLEACVRDGHSTAGSPGTGLGALGRMATVFEMFSTPGKGTVAIAEMRQRSAASDAASSWSVGAVCVPYPGERVCGDAWGFIGDASAATVAVCDGLGHGPAAAAAAAAAKEARRDGPRDGPRAVVERMHSALRPTRGAAAAVATLTAQSVRYCGVGNICASIVGPGRTHALVSHAGTLGHSAQRVAEFDYPWTASSTLVLHSDGISAHWKPEDWPGLWVRDPAIVAGALYRDRTRGNDDATVVVVRPA